MLNRRLRDINPELTYILGARCKDGIILVSDSRITRGNDISQGDKIIKPLDNAIVGASGTTALFTKLLRQVEESVQNGEIQTWNELITVVEDVTLKLNQRYVDRTREATDVLMAIKDSENDAKLYFVSPQGVAEEIRQIIAIGHGEPYGSLFLKKMWNSEMNMKQTAELGTFIITVIGMSAIDSSVDPIPQIWYVPYDGDIHRAGMQEFSGITSKSTATNLVFGNFLRNLLNNNEDVNDILEAEKHQPA